MVKCEVKFDNNPNGIYYSGQTLTGIVELTNDKVRKIRGLSLRIEGYAKCKWTESRGSGKRRSTTNYSGREDYLNTFSHLLGTADGNQMELSAGLHKFNFLCHLPQQLPTSFESKYGHIRYQVKVEMERPWKYDIKFCFAFTILKALDLNYESPGLRCPLKMETTKSFFMGLGSKLLFMSTEIPICGFVAGQTVPVTVRINNESNIEVEKVKVSLKKFIHYNSQTPRMKTKERIESAAEVLHNGVSGKNRGHIEALLTLPPVPPTNIAFCSVIQVTYEIIVLAIFAGLHRSVAIRMPIMMGTVPLQSYQYSSLSTAPMSNWNLEASSSNSQAEEANKTPTNAHRPASGASFLQELPPPSYHQAMGMISEADNDDELNDEKPFSPMYPVFDFSAGTSQPSSLQQQPVEPSPAHS